MFIWMGHLPLVLYTLEVIQWKAANMTGILDYKFCSGRWNQLGIF